MAKFTISYLSREDLLPADVWLWPGDDVFVIGYPLFIHDARNNLPVLRSGMLASAYGVPYEGNPLVLVDANLHEGISGSPVFVKQRNVFVGVDGDPSRKEGLGFYFVGVISASKNRPDGKREHPVGLNLCWQCGLIEEIITGK